MQINSVATLARGLEGWIEPMLRDWMQDRPWCTTWRHGSLGQRKGMEYGRIDKRI